MLDADTIDWIRTVVYATTRFLPDHIDQEDLVNEAVAACLEALQRHDPERSALRTFLEFRVRGAVGDALRHLDPLARSHRDWIRKHGRAERDVSRRTGGPASDADVADALGITPEKLFEMRERTSTVLVEPVYPVTGEPVEFPARQIGADELIEENQTGRLVRAAIDRLPADRKAVVNFYFFSGLTMASIGALMDITESRACQIMALALARLEKILGGESWRELRT